MKSLLHFLHQWWAVFFDKFCHGLVSLLNLNFSKNLTSETYKNHKNFIPASKRRSMFRKLCLAALLSFPGVMALAPDSLVPSPLQPAVEAIRPLIIQASFLVGGLFGLYFILIILRVYYDRQILHTLQHIQYDLDKHNQHLGISSSRDKKHLMGRMWTYLKSLFKRSESKRKRQ